MGARTTEARLERRMEHRSPAASRGCVVSRGEAGQPGKTRLVRGFQRFGPATGVSGGIATVPRMP